MKEFFSTSSNTGCYLSKPMNAIQTPQKQQLKIKEKQPTKIPFKLNVIIFPPFFKNKNRKKTRSMQQK